MKIAYLGIYPPTAPRDKVYVDELKKHGYDVVECVSNARGIKKYVDLYRQLKACGPAVRTVWAGYLSPGAVIVAYLAGGKKIFYNALASAYEAYILDRQVAPQYSFRAGFFWMLDFLAFHLAHYIFIESEAQRKYILKSFAVSPERLIVVFTGVNEEIFHQDVSIKKSDTFTVAFRGIFTPATGVEIVLKAAELLKEEPIHFWVSGWGHEREKVETFMREHHLSNVELNTVFLEPSVLRQKLLSAQVLLGQFSGNARLERTIQHKTGEALALGMPYITRDSESNRELLTDEENCLFVSPENPRELADKIRYLKSHQELLRVLGENARNTYNVRLAHSVLGKKVISYVEDLTK